MPCARLFDEMMSMDAGKAPAAAEIVDAGQN
jgi:hypothetical protein